MTSEKTMMNGDEQKKAPGSGGLAPEDYYFEDGMMVFTEAFHLKRGACCGSGCRHCPYPKAGSEQSRRAKS